MMATSLLRPFVAGLLTISVGACATTSTTSTTWVAPQPPRPGQVEAVQQVVEETRGDPVGGALLGALIGGLLFGTRRGMSPIGAVAGAGVGAAASQGSAQSQRFIVYVRFDDGARQAFVFESPCPFHPGQFVVLTERGLEAP